MPILCLGDQTCRPSQVGEGLDDPEDAEPNCEAQPSHAKVVRDTKPRARRRRARPKPIVPQPKPENQSALSQHGYGLAHPPEFRRGQAPTPHPCALVPQPGGSGGPGLGLIVCF